MGSLNTETPGPQRTARIYRDRSAGIRRAALGAQARARPRCRRPAFLPSLSPVARLRASLWPRFSLLLARSLPEAPFRQPPLYNKPVETSLCGWDSVRDERPRLGGGGGCSMEGGEGGRVCMYFCFCTFFIFPLEDSPRCRHVFWTEPRCEGERKVVCSRGPPRKIS